MNRRDGSATSFSIHGYKTGSNFYPHDPLGGVGANLGKNFTNVRTGDSPSKSKSPGRKASDEPRFPHII